MTEVDPGVAYFSQPGAPVTITNRGQWKASTAYKINDAVHRGTNKQSYVCLIANTGQDPVSQPTYWQLIVV